MKRLFSGVVIAVALLVSGIVFAEIDYSVPFEGKADLTQWMHVVYFTATMDVVDEGNNAYLLKTPVGGDNPWSGILVPGSYEDVEVSFRCKTDSEASDFLAIHVRASVNPGEFFEPWWTEAGYGFQINGNGWIVLTKRIGKGKLMGEISARGLFEPGFTDWRTVTVKTTGGFDGSPVVIEFRVDGQFIEFEDIATGDPIGTPLTEARGDTGNSMALFNWGANWWVADFQVTQL